MTEFFINTAPNFNYLKLSRAISTQKPTSVNKIAKVLRGESYQQIKSMNQFTDEAIHYNL